MKILAYDADGDQLFVQPDDPALPALAFKPHQLHSDPSEVLRLICEMVDVAPAAPAPVIAPTLLIGEVQTFPRRLSLGRVEICRGRLAAGESATYFLRGAKQPLTAWLYLCSGGSNALMTTSDGRSLPLTSGALHNLRPYFGCKLNYAVDAAGPGAEWVAINPIASPRSTDAMLYGPGDYTISDTVVDCALVALEDGATLAGEPLAVGDQRPVPAGSSLALAIQAGGACALIKPL